MINNIKFVDELKHHGSKELNKRIMEGIKVPPNNLVEELKEYFVNTPREQILKDWEKTVKYDNSDVTADKFIDFLERRREVIESTNSEIPADDFVLETNELEEDEAVKLVNKLLEFQEGLKSYNKEFNIFGDDITDYDKDYILQHIVINKVGVSKYLEWELYNREGIFLPEWFGMNLKDVMIKDLHARRLSAELEIETLEDKIRKIDREIERYENNSY